MHGALELPSRLVRRLAEVCVELEEAHDELEDFLVSQSPQLLRKLRRARRQHIEGKTRPYDDLARELGLSR